MAVLLLFWSSLGTWVAPDVNAQAIKTKFQYAVKVVCSLLGTFNDGVLVNGVYRTAVNVHNPTNQRIIFAKKVAVADREEATSRLVSPFKLATLGPDEALEIDCGDMAGFFCPVGGICIDFAALKGFWSSTAWLSWTWSPYTRHVPQTARSRRWTYL
jgi:hypothetical protein